MHSMMRHYMWFCSRYAFNIIPNIIFRSRFTSSKVQTFTSLDRTFNPSYNSIFSPFLVTCLDSFLDSACTQKHLALHQLHTFGFPSDSSRELNVFWHDGDPLGMDGTQVCIFKETNKVRLGGLVCC